MGRKLTFTANIDAAALLQVNPKEFYTAALLSNKSSSQFRQVLNVKEKTKIGSLGFGTLLFPAEGFLDKVANGGQHAADQIGVG